MTDKVEAETYMLFAEMPGVDWAMLAPVVTHVSLRKAVDALTAANARIAELERRNSNLFKFTEATKAEIISAKAREKELLDGLKMISRHAFNQDMNHDIFRVNAKEQADILIKGGDA